MSHLIYIIIFLFIIFNIKKIKWIDNISDKKLLIKIAILTFLSRVCIVYFLHDNIVQVSDFSKALYNSYTLNFSESYYRVVTHYILYPILNNYYYKVFGNYDLVSLIFNCFYATFISVLIYLITNKIFKNKKIGLLSALVYILWPSISFYVVIFTPDHVASLLLLLALYMFIVFKDNYFVNTKRYNLIISILIGIILGLSTFFKNFAPVFLVAFIIVILVEFMQKYDVARLKSIFCFWILIIISFMMTKQLVYLYLDNIVGQPVARNISICYLNVGLNSRSNGTYNESLYAMYFNDLESNNFNFKKTNLKIKRYLLEDIKSNYYRVPILMLEKSKIHFGADDTKVFWVKYSIDEKEYITMSKMISDLIMPATKTYYALIIFFMVLMCMINITIKNNNILLLTTIIFGSCILLSLVEAQGRYKYAIEPIMCILTAGGIYYVKAYFEVVIKNNKIFSKKIN